MNYYPIIIPTLNRYEHLKDCVDSLARCTGAEYTPLYISLDYPPTEKYRDGYNKIKAYLPTIKGFKTVTVFEQKENLGSEKNSSFLKSYVSQYYKAYILTEDDNIFSPNFLEYVNLGLDKFSGTPRVTSISGYNFVELYDQNGCEVFYRPVCSAWGVGRWFDKDKELESKMTMDFFKEVLSSWRLSWKVFITNASDLRLLMRMVQDQVVWNDVARCIINIVEDRYELAPAISMSKNMGHDGSGEHCGEASSDMYSNQVIDDRPSIVLGKINSSKTFKNRVDLFFCTLSKNPMKRFLSVLMIGGWYLKYRMTRSF